MDLQSEAEIGLVVSNNIQAQGVARARRSGVPIYITEKKIDWVRLNLELKRRQITQIFLLGFMRIIPPEFVTEWQGQILNLHPSLLPEYPGLHAIEKSYEEGAAMGVTVHIVVPEMDAGPILLQQKVLPAASSGRHSLTLKDAQFLICRAEQRLVRLAFTRGISWKQAPLQS